MKTPISIPKSCSANWSDMTNNELGKHCALCQKTVVDFTNWEIDSIVDYLKKNNAVGTCGRFQAKQHYTPATIDNDATYTNILKSNWTYMNKITALIALTLFTAVYSCNVTNSDDVTTPKHEDSITQNKEIFIMGVIVGEPVLHQSDSNYISDTTIH